MTHPPRPRLYLIVFASLLVLTCATVAAALHDFGRLGTPLALTIAVTKATLVALYFMHLRWSGRMTRVFFAAGVLWLTLLIGFTTVDFTTRDWTPGSVEEPTEPGTPPARR
jgi:cytochrome c oxidase subunit 4